MAANGELQDLFEDVDTLYEDLYEDVGDGRQLLRTSVQEMEERLDKLAKRDKEMEASLNDLQQQNESLQQEKSLLVRNISCLFKTAQLEIARKDRNIKELREENERLKSVNSHTPASHEKSRTRCRTFGAQHNIGSDVSGREYHSSSGLFERHSKEQQHMHELPAANGKAKESSNVSREGISSSEPGAMRELRVTFDHPKYNEAPSIDEDSTRHGKRMHVSGSQERAQSNARDSSTYCEPRRYRNSESEGREAFGGDRTRPPVGTEEDAERSKLRKVVPRRPSHRA